MRMCTPLHHSGSRRSAGFTMVELMITLVVLGLVMVVLSTVIYTAARSKTSTSNNIESSQGTRIAVDLIARDLRNAGFGADRDWNALPQPPIAYIDSTQVLINANLHGDYAQWDTTAYDPAGNPKPAPLNGTAWAPPIKYRTRAEIVRWTLDTNNDGVVDANDVADPDGVDAQRTPNPNDYMLVREIYADSSVAMAAGNNGGVGDRIALMRAPSTGGTPPLFTVYLFGSSTPWDWSNGPIPPGRLQDVERVVIRAVGTSAKADWRGNYSETQYETEVNVTRNLPNFGADEYAIDGYVYVDQNTNSAKDAGEPGVPGASMTLDAFSTSTDSTGYFQFRMVAGTYTLKHTPPAGYVNLTFPDSFVVTVGPPATRYFANAVQAGGNVAVLTFDDQDADGIHDAGEPVFPSVQVTLSPTSEGKFTNSSGLAQFFAPVGSFTLTVSPPSGYAVTSTHPYTNSMADGGSDSVAFGLTGTPIGTIEGKVFTDNNRNGVHDAGEPGQSNVWVGISPDGGLTVVGYQYTNASGDYSIDVPINDPPGTDPYYATIVVPNGYYPTSGTSVGPLLVQDSDVLTGKNFGVASFQVITLNASRVLSLGSADLIEKDWNGNDNQWNSKGHKDADIVLGADAGGTDNIATWFNQYNGSPLFDSNPTYTRNAPNSVLALRLETLDNNTPQPRHDAVTGTRFSGSGNFFVWFAQNSGGNLGYFSTTYDQAYLTADNGDVQAVLTADVGGGSSPDIIVGTKSPTAGTGTIEVWLSNDAATPTFTRSEIYPPNGSIPSNVLGEVTSMALSDLDGDGDKDLIVGTRTGNWTGQLMFFEYVSRTAGSRFVFRSVKTFNDQAVTSVVAAELTGDSFNDVVIGTQRSANAGRLEQWVNTDNLWTFALKRQVTPPGIVMSLAAADMGGLPRQDIIMGWRADETGYAGGLQIYFTDFGLIPPFGTDPTAGSVAFMVPALTVNNFNYGVQPSTPAAPYLEDFAAGVKTGPSTGALLVFIR